MTTKIGPALEGKFFLSQVCITESLRHMLKKGARDCFFSIDPATFLNLPCKAGRGKGKIDNRDLK